MVVLLNVVGMDGCIDDASSVADVTEKENVRYNGVGIWFSRKIKNN